MHQNRWFIMFEILPTILALEEKEKRYLYNLGVDKCQIGNFEEAAKIFSIVALLDNENCVYHKALAGALHGMAKYDMACTSYTRVLSISNTLDNFDCLFYIADCLIRMDKKADAQVKLTQLIELCVDNSMAIIKYQPLIKRAKLLLKGM